MTKVPRPPRTDLIFGDVLTAYKKKTGEPYLFHLRLQHLHVLDYLHLHAPATDREIVMGIGLSHAMGVRRMELQQAGYIKQVGFFEPPTGPGAIQWGLNLWGYRLRESLR